MCVLIARFDVALQNASFGFIHQGLLQFGLAVMTGDLGCTHTLLGQHGFEA